MGFSRQEYCSGLLYFPSEPQISWLQFSSVQSLSRVRFLGTSWTAAYQAPPSMGFSKQEYWSVVPLPSPHSSLTGVKLWAPCIGSVES